MADPPAKEQGMLIQAGNFARWGRWVEWRQRNRVRGVGALAFYEGIYTPAWAASFKDFYIMLTGLILPIWTRVTVEYTLKNIKCILMLHLICPLHLQISYVALCFSATKFDEQEAERFCDGGKTTFCRLFIRLKPTKRILIVLQWKRCKRS